MSKLIFVQNNHFNIVCTISSYFEKKFNKYTVIKICYYKKYILKYRNEIILISKDSESIEGDPIIIEYIFTEVTNKHFIT